METFNIDHSSAIPLHLQVEDLLRDLIKIPAYQEGKLLPNEVALAKQLGISRNTVRQATNKLVYERLLVRKKGVGTTVAQNNIITKLDKWLSFTHEMGESGVSFRNYRIDATWVEADQELRQLFNIARKSEVLKLERLRGVETGPVVLFISYFHPRVGLTGDEDFTQPLYDMLEKRYHTVAAVSKEGISAILADAELSEKLEIAIGDPVLFRKRVVCDPGGRPIEYNLGFYRADSFTYTIEIKRE
ncbi:GntR family transcriptional regulator [Hymenobacter sp. ASUV-10]|uniref:GntR family transcriptional regulator n=1 Tax=Hymenobacter aranciens TaxID=3063996 RepID=A0ABT9BC72_9BACT|nr:GntR family transcriptional regulator [Hymenobacter sp. ASUV-10]MDO7875870.1 GntR family transcriptional regulator [Hymenobacter sp. ASUV-10]